MSASQTRKAIEDYGRVLQDPPEDAYALIDAIRVITSDLQT